MTTSEAGAAAVTYSSIVPKLVKSVGSRVENTTASDIQMAAIAQGIGVSMTGINSVTWAPTGVGQTVKVRKTEDEGG